MIQGAVLLVSADLDELYQLSDSLMVMSGGQIAAYFTDPSSVTQTELGQYMLGAVRQSDEEIARACYTA